MKILNTNSYHKRIYEWNNIFEPMTKEGAYILGFTMADGCIPKNLKQVRWNLSLEDLSQLELIKKYLSPNSKIKFNTRFNKKTKVTTKDCLLIVSSVELVKIFHKYGIISNKTGQESIPNLNSEMQSHFLRGLFDGDGCIFCNTKTRKYSISLSSLSPMLLEQIKKFSNLGKILKIKNKNHYEWRLEKYNNITKYCNYLYKDSENLRLERKYNKFIEIQNLSSQPKKKVGAKLKATIEDIQIIKYLYKFCTQKEISDIYNISKCTLQRYLK